MQDIYIYNPLELNNTTALLPLDDGTGPDWCNLLEQSAPLLLLGVPEETRSRPDWCKQTYLDFMGITDGSPGPGGISTPGDLEFEPRPVPPELLNTQGGNGDAYGIVKAIGALLLLTYFI